jgi:hypothetical protein
VPDKSLDDIRFSFARDFEHYLSTVQKIGSNTSMKYINNVKQVLKIAADQVWIQVNPLSCFKCSYDEPQREWLTMEEIMKLYNKDLLIPGWKKLKMFTCSAVLPVTLTRMCSTSQKITSFPESTVKNGL